MSTQKHQLSPDKPHSLTTKLSQDGQEETIKVFFIGHNSDHFTLTTTTHHQAQHTHARTVVRGVLYDQASADIKGMIKIDPAAQHTDAFLEQKILLIGKRARVNAEPMLEIEANQVKASHAATISYLDPEQLFYLMSRGLPKPKAIKLLTKGFLQPAK